MVLHFGGLAALGTRGRGPSSLGRAWSGEMRYCYQVRLFGPALRCSSRGVIRRRVTFVGEKGAFGNEKTYIGNEKLDYVRN